MINKSLKPVIKSFIPPILVNISSQFRHVFKATTPFEAVSAGWNYVGSKPGAFGWDVRGVRDAYLKKWPRFLELLKKPGPLGFSHESDMRSNSNPISHNINITFGYIMALLSRNKDKVSILDWGGGIGHYYLLARAMVPGIDIEYHCKEVPILVEAGRSLLPDVTFHDNEECLNRQYDLVIASTSLHYSEDWTRVLDLLARAARQYLFINRLPLVNKTPSFVMLQRVLMYQTEYLSWCFNRSEFLEAASGLDMSLMREFIVGHAHPVKGISEECEYRGFLFEN